MLLLVAAPLLFFARYIITQKLVQYEMEERLENSLLQTITIDPSAIQWVKKNKEVSIDGKLFDVKSISHFGTKIILTGLFDADENKLKEAFARIMHLENKEPIAATHFIIKFIFSTVYCHIPAIKTASFEEAIKIAYPFYSEALVSQFLSLKTPPPNV